MNVASDEISFEKTYKLAVDPPPPMAWEVYERIVLEAWTALLARAPEEFEVQAFLETHPSMVPGAFSAFGRPSSGHGPYMSAVVTQPPLRAHGMHIPDFLWMSRDSSFFNPVFVEIEKPSKPWLTSRGVQSAPLTQALDQIRRWREWLDTSANQQIFLDHFAVPPLFRKRSFEPIFVVVYGQRGSNADAVDRVRVDLSRRDQFVIPYEQLRPDRACLDFICVENRSGRYGAVSFPPTVGLGPATAEEWSTVEGRELAIQRNPLITEERKRFLLDRLSYWDEHARSGGRASRAGDRE